MAITMHGEGFPLKLVCTDNKILAYLNGTLFATLGTGTDGAESTLVLPGLDGTGFAAATSASDSDKVDGLHAASFSLANGTRAFTGVVSGTGAYFSGSLSATTFHYGTYVACAGASGVTNGYISILDSAGTTRYIPVWS